MDLKNTLKIINNQNTGGLAWVPKNRSSFTLLLGDEESERPGLEHSEIV